MVKPYRKGAIGALTNEYEKALDELKNLLLQIPDTEFQEVYNENIDIDFQFSGSHDKRNYITF